MTQEDPAPASGPHAGGPEGLERWLTSRPRIALISVAAASLATVATTMGEVELQQASDMLTTGAERNLLLQSGATWLAWALLAPLILRIATNLAQSTRRWYVAAMLHLPLAFGFGIAFLAGEIALQEAMQSSEDTELFREIMEFREQMRSRGGSGEGRRSRPGRRRHEEAPAAGQGEGSSAEETGDPRRDRSDARPGDDARPGAQGERERQRPPFTPDQFRRARRMGFRDTANVATGDFAADFERRWRLRVPRYGLIYMVLVAIGLGTRAFLVGRQREREAVDLELRTERLEAELTEARLTALKGQLHPHFLFNALHSVGGLIRAERGTRALTALAQIGDLLRTSLDAGGEQFVPLGREIELVQRYLDVEALRLGERLRVQLDVPSELEECEVPAFITQPLVENALKHGISQLPEGGTLSLTVRATGEDTLEIVVDNDGPAPSPEATPGVGLGHVRTRLATLFEGAGSLELGGGPGGSGARATLRLPLDDVED